MEFRFLSHLLFVIAATFCIVVLSQVGLTQTVVLESAQLGTIGRVGGTTITGVHYAGWRFQTSVALSVDQVGGHMLANPSSSGDIFAALVRLSSITAFPLGSPFDSSEVVATTTFRPNFPSEEILTPLSAKLIPGSYALIFGSNLFGATGEAALHNGTDQPDIPPTTIASYILWSVPSPGQSATWRTNLASNMRFVIVGQETNFTADFDNDDDVDTHDLGVWQGAYAANASGDADGDGDTDGRDLLAWQRQYTGSAGDGSSLILSSVPVPEPLTISLLLVFAMAFASRRCSK